MNRACVAFVLLLVVLSRSAAAQSDESQFQIGVQVVGAVSGEFDSTDAGVSVRFSGHPTAFLGAEAEVGFYPEDFADEPAFTSSRVEGLFGLTVGPHIRRLRPFAKMRSGFVTFREAPEPLACVAIFPPPLPCTLAAGETVLALDLGGGVEVLPTGRTFFRIDMGDRLVRYPGPALDRDGAIREDAFFSHDIRFAIGVGVRF